MNMTAPGSSSDGGAFGPEERAALKHEEFIAEVMKRRASPSRTHWLWRLLESSGGTALIVAVFGGGFGAVITHELQQGAKEREFQNGMIEIYGQHKLAAQSGFLVERIKVVREALDLVGATVALCNDVISLDGPAFAVRLDAEADRALERQKHEIRQRFNDTVREWAVRRGSLGVLIGHFFDSDSRLAWDALAKSVDGFVQCATDHRPGPQGQEHGCRVESAAAVEASLEAFESAAGLSKSTAWLTHDEASQLREALSVE